MNHDFKSYLDTTGEVGFVNKTVSSLVYTDGLPGAKLEELVVFESGGVGQVAALGPFGVEIFSFSNYPIAVGTRVARTDKELEIPVGEEFLGKVINPLGDSFDPTQTMPVSEEVRHVDTLPLGVGSRSRIKRQCETGVTLVDLVFPIGKGQRELIIGDQKTGKSYLLWRMMLSQVKAGTVGIYALVGKGKAVIKRLEQSFREAGVFDGMIFVATSSDDSSGLTYLAPYSAMAMAEYFRDKGRDVLVVFDDLSAHAKAYREISLLAKKFPGRNSYPGDIFYVHSKLLERAGNFLGPKGDVSITCLPVVETAYGDITGYIQTNAMSMTDGHLFFDRTLFIEGRRPAIDPFRSVTRVGRQTQNALRRQIGRTLLTFFQKTARLHSLASFETELGERVAADLKKEKRLLQIFDQTAYDLIAFNLQVLLFGLAWGDFWQGKTEDEVRLEIQKMVFAYESRADIRKKIDLLVEECGSLEALLARIKNFQLPWTDWGEDSLGWSKSPESKQSLKPPGPKNSLDKNNS